MQRTPQSVSNAFRLCAYPAVRWAIDAMRKYVESPMPFGCVPIRQEEREHGLFIIDVRLQCLSAVCLSGSPLRWTPDRTRVRVSNAFRLCAYPAGRRVGCR